MNSLTYVVTIFVEAKSLGSYNADCWFQNVRPVLDRRVIDHLNSLDGIQVMEKKDESGANSAFGSLADVNIGIATIIPTFGSYTIESSNGYCSHEDFVNGLKNVVLKTLTGFRMRISISYYRI